MINFASVVPSDIPQIEEWVAADPFHQDMGIKPEDLLTGASDVLSFCINDSTGPTMYVRFDKEDEFFRMHVQFGPEDEVSRRRVVLSIREAMPALITLAKLENAKGFVFESTNPSLIKFMGRLFGFKPRAGSEYVDDHILVFDEVS